MSNISASAYPEKFLNLLEKEDSCKGALPWPFIDNYALESQDKYNSYEQEYNYTEYTEDLYDENNTDYNYDSLAICSLKEGSCAFLLYSNKECKKRLNKTKLDFQKNDTFCPGRFDGFMCWPHGRAHSLVEAPCPPGIQYGEVLTDQLKTFRGPPGVRGPPVENHWSNAFVYASLCGEHCDTSKRLAICPLPVNSNYITTMGILYYAMTANYFWLLIEGGYLQWYINLAKTKDEKVEKLLAFVLFGWGGPILSVGVWLVLVIAVQNHCWKIDSQQEQFSLAVNIPIILSILINFILFINIMRIVFSKLRAEAMQKKDKIVRLALSTLALVTLLGTQHTVFFFLWVALASLGNDTKDVRSLELVCISFQVSIGLYFLYYCIQ
ncbi:unnamed protein product [Clavelina lepadiformis]|uniref:Uncharacterized protein n=1 Tax=Clavelina lepadiformis TaxID=159417 RepID=A0ABP0FYF6_CLALP